MTIKSALINKADISFEVESTMFRVNLTRDFPITLVDAINTSLTVTGAKNVIDTLIAIPGVIDVNINGNVGNCIMICLHSSHDNAATKTAIKEAVMELSSLLVQGNDGTDYRFAVMSKMITATDAVTTEDDAIQAFCDSNKASVESKTNCDKFRILMRNRHHAINISVKKVTTKKITSFLIYHVVMFHKSQLSGLEISF